MPHAQNDAVLPVSFVAPERSVQPSENSAFSGQGLQAFASIANLDEFLLAEGFSQSNLNKMTVNDKQYQVRLLLEAGTAFTPLPTTITAASDPTNEVEPWGTVWKNTVDNGVWQSHGDGTWTEVAP